MKHLTRPILLLTLLSSLLLSTALPAFAQNFYGSGNVRRGHGSVRGK